MPNTGQAVTTGKTVAKATGAGVIMSLVSSKLGNNIMGIGAGAIVSGMLFKDVRNVVAVIAGLQIANSLSIPSGGGEQELQVM